MTQQKSIIGKVVDDATRAELPGVSVFINGTNTGTMTDNTGKYSMTVDQGSTVVFSLIGYENKEVQVAEYTVVNVVLYSDFFFDLFKWCQWDMAASKSATSQVLYRH